MNTIFRTDRTRRLNNSVRSDLNFTYELSSRENGANFSTFEPGIFKY